MSESSISDPDVVDKIQDDIVAMFKAWEDRGITPQDACQVLTATGLGLLACFGFSLGSVVILVTQQWEKNDGQL